MDRSQEIIRTSWIGIVTNVLLAGFKAVVGVLASSVAIVMDAVNNLSDALSSVITIVGTKLSQRPADRKHPFGFGRIEYFSAIIIAVIVLSAGVTSLIESVKKIFDPTTPEYTKTTLLVIVVAIVVKLVLGQYVKRKGEALKSDALIASGSDALFDAVITLATLVSAGVMLMWNVSLDGILGALISIVIIKAGIEMLASPINELLGTSIPAELTKQIVKEVSEFIKKSVCEFDQTREPDQVNVRHLDEWIENMYKEEESLGKLITIASFVALLIAIIGIIGLVFFETQFLRKEIAVRRVNGATVESILGMINRKYLIMAGISFLIASPVAYLIITNWRKGFAYQSPVPVWIFIAALAFVAAVTFGVVTLQSWRAANANPVDSLKNE